MWVGLQQKAPFIIINFWRVPPSHDYNTLRCDLHIYHPFLSYIFLKALVLSEEEGDYVITSSLPPSSSTWPVSIKTHNVRMHLCCGFELYQTKKRRCGLSTLPNMTRLTLVCLSICLLVSVYDVQSAAVLESGVRVTDAAKVVIDKIKAGKDFRYGVFLVKNETLIDVESTGSRTASYDEYLKHLKAVKPTGKECRYGVLDVEFQCKSSPDKKRDKLVLMSWCPDEVKVRSKFIHAASVEGMKKAVPGISAFVQASDDEQASMPSVQDKLTRTVTAC
ncbi:cofilin/actin-depolymerizing factor homolog isoform X1 [Daphnia magna]|uniref:cofilin/actin-depolymerizing factor homolog isoform X1 n=1 Tax=Daphnia magna TaxID=35525 RepID=UPI001E1BD743|nr:cofilin/actin-depolymerizing factor homolog isoform X1 [Daphnia magna]